MDMLSRSEGIETKLRITQRCPPNLTLDMLSRSEGIETHHWRIETCSTGEVALDMLSRSEGIETNDDTVSSVSASFSLDMLSRSEGIETLTSSGVPVA